MKSGAFYLEHSEYILGGWSWQILGMIRTVARAAETGEILYFFCQAKNALFYQYPVSQSQEI